LSNGYLTLLELDGFNPEQPNLNETVVRFTRSDDDRVLIPRKIVWTVDDPGVDDDVFAFVLTQGSDDIISLNLLPGETLDDLDRPRISPSLNQLTAGRSPVDIDVYLDRNGVWKLLALNAASQDLSIIDVGTSDTVHIPIEEPLDRLLLYTAINSNSNQQEPFALLYSTDSSSRALLFVELETAAVRRTRAIDRLNLQRGLTQLQMTTAVGDIPRALILHTGGTSFSILNMERRFVTPLDVSSQVSDYTFASDDTLLTVLQGQPYITLIDMQTGHPTIVELDLPARSVEVINATNSVVIDHGDIFGTVTVMRLDRPTRDNATMLYGIATADLFELEDPQ
jgi:hypothetical protein